MSKVPEQRGDPRFFEIERADVRRPAQSRDAGRVSDEELNIVLVLKRERDDAPIVSNDGTRERGGAI